MTVASEPRLAQKAGTGWREVYLGGSKEAEDELIRRRLAPAVNHIQRDIRDLQGQSKYKRAQHGKQIAATKNALSVATTHR